MLRREYNRGLSQLAEKFNPKSTCVFCNVEAQKDGHSSGRCPNYSDAVARGIVALLAKTAGYPTISCSAQAEDKEAIRQRDGNSEHHQMPSPNDRYRSDAKPILLFELAAGSIVDSDDGHLSMPRLLVGRYSSTSIPTALTTFAEQTRSSSLCFCTYPHKPTEPHTISLVTFDDIQVVVVCNHSCSMP
ncbi:unnamed protein product [Heligmosomoides polygyrus]|uniref:CCHC-type domain-containing protein n=1 Tax=Heligmosomoides polygyrus TaxID=6339 RepID=A0A183GR75_HELPZ|nr:unnamed protein product [Heligmosomoides polygyrus]